MSRGEGCIEAGAAARVLELPAGLPLAGYVVEAPRLASEPNRDLEVRALVLHGGSNTVVMVSFDLLYGSAGLTAALRNLVGEAHGIAPGGVLVHGTHSHCTPRDITSRADPELVRSLALQGAKAVADAFARLAPVGVVSGVAGPLGIGRNRREAARPVDDAAQLVLLRSCTGGAVATIVNLACHPVVLDEHTRSYHTDFVGPLRATVDEAIGGVCIFLQGFAGDVNPVVLGRTDAEARRIGARVGGVVVARFAEMLSGFGQLAFFSLSEHRAIPVEGARARPHRGPVSAGLANVVVRRRPLVVSPRPDALPTALEAEEWITGRLVGNDPIFNSMEMGGDDAEGVPLEVQTITVGQGLVLVAFPGEPLGATRSRVVARFPDSHVLTIGYSNGAPGYLPHRDAYPSSGYEVGCSIVAPGAVEQLVEATIDPRHPEN